MFVITIGPLHKQWGKIIKLLALGVVLLLIVLVAWRIMGSMSQPAPTPSDSEGTGQALATYGQNLGSGFWQRFLNALQHWFKYEF
jgi:flagellar biogenesis protein FliO